MGQPERLLCRASLVACHRAQCARCRGGLPCRPPADRAAHPAPADPAPAHPVPVHPAPNFAALLSLRRSPRATRWRRCGWTPPCWVRCAVLRPAWHGMSLAWHAAQLAGCWGGLMPVDPSAAVAPLPAARAAARRGSCYGLRSLRALPAHPAPASPTGPPPPPTPSSRRPEPAGGQAAVVHCLHGHLRVQEGADAGAAGAGTWLGCCPLPAGCVGRGCRRGACRV